MVQKNKIAICFLGVVRVTSVSIGAPVPPNYPVSPSGLAAASGVHPNYPSIRPPKSYDTTSYHAIYGTVKSPSLYPPSSITSSPATLRPTAHRSTVNSIPPPPYNAYATSLSSYHSSNQNIALPNIPSFSHTVPDAPPGASSPLVRNTPLPKHTKRRTKNDLRSNRGQIITPANISTAPRYSALNATRDIPPNHMLLAQGTPLHFSTPELSSPIDSAFESSSLVEDALANDAVLDLRKAAYLRQSNNLQESAQPSVPAIPQLSERALHIRGQKNIGRGRQRSRRYVGSAAERRIMARLPQANPASYNYDLDTESLPKIAIFANSDISLLDSQGADGSILQGADGSILQGAASSEFLMSPVPEQATLSDEPSAHIAETIQSIVLSMDELNQLNAQGTLPESYEEMGLHSENVVVGSYNTVPTPDLAHNPEEENMLPMFEPNKQSWQSLLTPQSYFTVPTSEQHLLPSNNLVTNARPIVDELTLSNVPDKIAFNAIAQDDSFLIKSLYDPTVPSTAITEIDFITPDGGTYIDVNEPNRHADIEREGTDADPTQIRDPSQPKDNPYVDENAILKNERERLVSLLAPSEPLNKRKSRHHVTAYGEGNAEESGQFREKLLEAVATTVAEATKPLSLSGFHRYPDFTDALNDDDELNVFGSFFDDDDVAGLVDDIFALSTLNGNPHFETGTVTILAPTNKALRKWGMTEVSTSVLCRATATNFQCPCADSRHTLYYFRCSLISYLEVFETMSATEKRQFLASHVIAGSVAPSPQFFSIPLPTLVGHPAVFVQSRGQTYVALQTSSTAAPARLTGEQKLTRNGVIYKLASAPLLSPEIVSLVQQSSNAAEAFAKPLEK